MTSEELQIRNQQNAQNSTGPRSPEGKRRSSLNSYRNGLTGQIVCQSAEDLAAFQKHCAAIVAELAPQGAIQTALAVAVAEDLFRLARARAIENGIFANGHLQHVESIDAGHPEIDTSLAQAKTWEAQAHHFSLLTVYEGRIRRTLEKNTAELKALQAGQKEKHERAVREATLFMEHAEAKGETYDPGDDFSPASDHGGFVFSAGALKGSAARKRRFDAAYASHQHRLQEQRRRIEDNQGS